MKLITKTRVRRALIPLAALAVAAAIVPTAGAADCTMAPGANCQNQDMRHLGKQMMGADMTGADMRGADMRGMNLTGINFTNADMRGAKLSGAKLNGANMSGTKMNGMTMRRVSMNGVNLNRAKMSGMRLYGVNMTNSTFTDTDMRGSHFIGGSMAGSILVGTKLGPKPSGAGKSTRAINGCSTGGTLFQGTGIGWAWENDYNFGSAIWDGVDASCSVFSAVTWSHMTIKNSNLSYTTYKNAQNLSQQIYAENVNYTGAHFNNTFWAPGLAFGVKLDGATCDAVASDPLNGVWGHYTATSPVWVGSAKSGQWTFGVVTSSAFGSFTFASAPAAVGVPATQYSQLSGVYSRISKPYVTGVNTKGCQF